MNVVAQAFQQACVDLNEIAEKFGKVGRVVFIPSAPTIAMAEAAPTPDPSAARQKEKEIEDWYNANLLNAQRLKKLVVLKHLRLEMPHVSTHPSGLESEIRKELKAK